MARRNKQYRLRMTNEEFEKLEKLSHKLGVSKSTIIRHALKNCEMTLYYLSSDREAIRQAYSGGFTHAAQMEEPIIIDTQLYPDEAYEPLIKSTKPNIEPIGGAKN